MVVGAGIAGLSCAVRLRERGWSVRVLADAPVEASTSHLAAAVWFPTRAGPRDKVLEHLAGLRPARPEVRLEAEPATATRPRVIHDYGHGGSGITLSWGCADDVADLADAP